MCHTAAPSVHNARDFFYLWSELPMEQWHMILYLQKYINGKLLDCNSTTNECHDFSDLSFNT